MQLRAITNSTVGATDLHSFAVPEVPLASTAAELSLGCAGLLVGDSEASQQWPSKLWPMPAELEGLCEYVKISLQVRACWWDRFG